MTSLSARPISRRRRLGQYMTPAVIATQMARLLRRPVSEWRVLDPACGDGNLLLAAAEMMRAAGLTDLRQRVMGFDIDEEMVEAARRKLSAFLQCETHEVLIHHADFLALTSSPLLGDPIAGFGWTYNAVLSNPPYGQSREYDFFARCDAIAPRGTEFVFLVPLSFIDRASGVHVLPLVGRPMQVTTGHAIVRHVAGDPYRLRAVRTNAANGRMFQVLTGVKLYEVGAGVPPQTQAIVNAKPFSSGSPRPNWWPCVRTGDIQPDFVALDRMWVDYGVHLAHPKDAGRFTGPRLFVRRVPIWSTRRLGAVYIDAPALCAGDVLVVRHDSDDQEVLRGLCVYLNSPEAAEGILEHRPSVRYRTSFPKISAKDLNNLLDTRVPPDSDLRSLAKANQ